MIVFDLKCAAAHVFEAWFGSSADYDDQRARGLVQCPICGDGAVEKAVMAPNVAAKRNQQAEVTPAAVKTALATLAKAQATASAASQAAPSRAAHQQTLQVFCLCRECKTICPKTKQSSA